MAASKFDFKKEYKDLYLPGKKPALIEVPDMNFIMVDGRGEPGGESYQKAISALYALTFTIKMSKMGTWQPDGYFDYVVPPLEGLWWSADGKLDLHSPRESWLWTSMIRQPAFVTPDVFAWAKAECIRKKPEVDVSAARFETFQEGLCVQIMHVGPYSEEERSMKLIADFMEENALLDESGKERKHHEIYLGDPRKTAPERLRTVLRTPVLKFDHTE